jgi:hypothetical protein
MEYHKKAPPEGEAGLFMGEEIYLAELQADFSAAQQLFCAAHSVVFSVEQAFFSEQAAFFAEHSVLLAEHSAFSPAYAENPATISATAAILSAFFIVCLLKGFSFILVSLTLVLRLRSIKTEFFFGVCLVVLRSRLRGGAGEPPAVRGRLGFGL